MARVALIIALVREAISPLYPSVCEARRPITLISGLTATSAVELNRDAGVHCPRTLDVPMRSVTVPRCGVRRIHVTIQGFGAQKALPLLLKMQWPVHALAEARLANREYQQMIRRTMYAWLINHAWLHYCEVVVRRHGREHIVARVASPRGVRSVIANICRDLEISRSAVAWRRVRGVHPLNAAKGCLLLLLMTLLLPWFWPRLVLGLVCIALTCGLSTSGTSWKRGGLDDR